MVTQPPVRSPAAWVPTGSSPWVRRSSSAIQGGLATPAATIGSAITLKVGVSTPGFATSSVPSSVAASRTVRRRPCTHTIGRAPILVRSSAPRGVSRTGDLRIHPIQRCSPTLPATSLVARLDTTSRRGTGWSALKATSAPRSPFTIYLTSRLSRSSTVSRRKIRRACPFRTATTAGRPIKL